MESRLSSKIKICEHLESISEEQTLEVLGWMKEELQCADLNQLVIKMLMHSKELFTNEALTNISNKTNLRVAQNNSNSATNHNINHFPLVKLPTDIISTMALFLNQKQLLCFESCNRMFYKIVNNASFLKKCQSFEQFRLTDKFLQLIASQEIDCYKLMFATELIFDLAGNDCDEGEESILVDLWLEATRKKFMDLLYYANKSYHYHSNWLAELFKSVEKIIFDESGMLLIDLIPVNVIFDKDNSQLRELRILQSSTDSEILIKSFIAKYSKMEEPKVLDIVRIVDPSLDELQKLLVFTMRHLILSVESIFEHINLIYLGNERLNSHLKRLTLDYMNCIPRDRIGFDYEQHRLQLLNKIRNGIKTGININTLRLFGKDVPWKNVITDRKFMQCMNFQNNLRNLTIGIEIEQQADDFIDIINNIIKKDYLFNLENVNILIKRYEQAGYKSQMVLNVNEVIDKLFGILNDNIKLLKYQFKQLNFGMFRHFYWQRERYERYQAFSWNSNIDTKFINDEKEQWKLLANSSTITKYDPISEEIYQNAQQQWVQSARK